MKIPDSKDSIFFSQYLPLLLTLVICVFLVGALYIEILLLNIFTKADIATTIRWSDVLIGLTIYLKTSVDFAIFIGNLMAQFPGWRGRVAIELGTALGNALGTMIILAIWNIFRNVEILLAMMVFVASLVLLKLAQESLEHAAQLHDKPIFGFLFRICEKSLRAINRTTGPVLNILIPNVSMSLRKNVTLVGLFGFSFSIPFILGLDDFAGYVPVFNLVNVFGFAIGVFVGHMILNIFLFLSPEKTIAAVKNPLISFAGTIAFIGLAIWGFYETFHILSQVHF